MAKAAGQEGIDIGDCQDFLAGFDFEEETLVYHDAPIGGFMVQKKTRLRFAFSCSVIVRDLLWHWSLVPAPTETDADLVIRGLDDAATPEWISVVEDRRLTTPRFTVAIVPTAKGKPPLSA